MRSATILVLERNVAVQELIEQVLRDAGHRVLCTNDAGEALDVMRRVQVDVFVAGGLVAAGIFAAAWRRDLTAALAGVPLMFAGAGAAFVGIARFAAAGGSIAFGQEFAVLLAIAAVALVALGLGIAGREGSR